MNIVTRILYCLKLFLKKIIWSRLFILLLIILTVVIIFRDWFTHGLVPLSYCEWGFYYPERMRDFVSMPFIWDGALNAGQYNMEGLPVYYRLLITGILGITGIEWSIIEKFLYGTIPFISACSMYFLTYHLFKNRVVAFFSSFLYTLNPYVLYIAAVGRFDRMMVFSLSPFILLFFIKSLEENGLKNSLITGIMLAISTAYEPRQTLLTGISLIVYLIFFLVKKPCSIKDIVHQAKKVFFSLFVLTVLNLFWVLPYILYKPLPLPQGYISSTALQRFSSTLLDSFMSVVPQWFGTPLTRSTPFFKADCVPFFKILLLLVPIFASMAILLKPRNRTVIYFVALLMISLFFSKGSNPPLGEINLWLFHNVPGFQYFRISSKFFMLGFLSASPLFGISVAEISEKISVNGILHKTVSYKQLQLRLIFLTIFTLILLINITPAVSNSLGGTFEPRTVPQEYLDVNEWLKHNQDGYRAMWVPLESRYSLLSANHPVINMFAFGDFGNYLFYTSWQYTPPSDSLAKVIGVANAKYVIVPADVEDKASTPFQWGQGPDYYWKVLDAQNGFSLAYSTEMLRAYENVFAVPRIYATHHGALVVGGQSALFALSLFNGLNFSEWAIIFSDQLKWKTLNMLDVVDAVVFYETDMNDVILTSVDRSYRFDFWDYGNDSEIGWVKDTLYFQSPYSKGGGLYGLTHGEISQSEKGVVYSLDQAEMRISLIFPKPDEYDIWLRAGFGPDTKRLDVEFNGSLIVTEGLYAKEYKFKWLKLGTFRLNQGKSDLTLISKTAGIVLDQLVVSPHRVIETLEQEIEHAITHKKIIFIKEAESYLNLGERSESDASTTRVAILDGATMFNNNAIYKRGKFFQRGVRGFIDSVEIYSDNTDTVDHTLTIRLAPYVGAEPTISTTLPMARDSAATWRSIPINQTWNYDSMFIWVLSDNDAYGRVGVDTGTPYDYYESIDEKTWYVSNFRLWIRVNMKGETAGDTRFQFYIPTEGMYRLAARITSQNNSIIMIHGPDKLSSSIYWDGTHIFRETEPTFLERGSHLFALRPNSSSEISLDQLVLLGTSGNDTRIAELFKVDDPIVVSWKYINPTKYHLTLSNGSKLFLLFTETYDQNWQVVADNREVNSMPAYSIMNSFYIDEVSETTISLNFEPQRYVYMGIWSSLLMIVVFFPIIWFRRVVRKNPNAASNYMKSQLNYATDFIGSHIADKLIFLGREITAID